MMQTQPAWQALPGADHISPEDESWLEQSDFRFFDDSEEDDMHDVTARAYVQAISSLKDSAFRSRRFTSTTQGQAPLLLELPQTAVAQQNASSSEPTSVSASSPKVSPGVLADLAEQKAIHAGLPATQQAREHTPPIDAQHQSTMHALQLLFPQEVSNAKSAQPQPSFLTPQPPDPPGGSQLATPAAPLTEAAADPETALAHAEAQEPQAPALPADNAADVSNHDAVSSAAHQQGLSGKGQAQPEPEHHDGGSADGCDGLHMALSGEQLSLLQAAYDNAQQYLEKDSAHAGLSEAGKQTAGAGAVNAVPQGTQLDLQSAIMQAVRSMSPDATPTAAQTLAQLTKASTAQPALEPVSQALVATLGPQPQTNNVSDAPAVVASAIGTQPQTGAASGAPAAAATASSSQPQTAATSDAPRAAAIGSVSQPQQAAASALRASGSDHAAINSPAASAVAADPVLSKGATSTRQGGKPGAFTPSKAADQRAAQQTAKHVSKPGQFPEHTGASDTPAIAGTASGIAGIDAPASNKEKQGPAVALADHVAKSVAHEVALPATTAAASASTAALPACTAVFTASTAADPASTPASSASIAAGPASIAAGPASTVADPASTAAGSASSAAVVASLADELVSMARVATFPAAVLASAAAASLSTSQQHTALRLPPSLTPLSGTGVPTLTPLSGIGVPGNPLGLPYAITPESALGVALTPGATPAPALSAPGGSWLPSQSHLPISLTPGVPPGGASSHLPVSLTPGGMLSESFPVVSQSQLPVSLSKQDGASQYAVHDGLFGSPFSPGLFSPAPQQDHATQFLPPPPPTSRKDRKKRRREPSEASPDSWQEAARTLESKQAHAAQQAEGSTANQHHHHQSASEAIGKADQEMPAADNPDITADHTPSQKLYSPGQATPDDVLPSSKRQRQHSSTRHISDPGAKSAERRHIHPSSKRQRSDLSPPRTSNPGTKPTEPHRPSNTPPSDPRSLAGPSPKRHRTQPSEAASPELAAMRAAHGDNAYPLVGCLAVAPQLRNVRSLMTKRHHGKYNLLDVINAIGWFAIGPDQEVDYFLGDLHNSQFHQQQIYAVGTLFGVLTSSSRHPDRLHEKFHLTRLTKGQDAGILTHNGDMLVYFIIQLNELSKINGKKGDAYKREHRAILDLANAVGRMVQGSGPNGLKKSCMQRIQQLHDIGYLAAKRPKVQAWNPPKYPGWQGVPRYGPPSPAAQPPPKLQSLVSLGYLTVNGPSTNNKPDASPQWQPPQPQLLPTPPGLAETAATAAAPPERLPLPLSLLTDSSATAAAVPTQQQAAAATAVGSKQASAAGRPVSMYASFNMPQASHSFAFPSAATSSWALNLGKSQPSLLPPPPPSAAAMVPSHAAASPVQIAASPPVGLSNAVPPLPRQSASAMSSGQGQLSDTTAALVAAVGPLFETFVAQAGAVMADPNVSVQALTSSITQELAAAIAAAAMQLATARRQ